MWRKLHKLLFMKSEYRNLYIEAFLFLAWARILKALPFHRVAPSLGFHMEETPLELEPSYLPILKNISKVVNTMSRYTWWESKCLVKAIAAMKMLERRKLESTLYLGTWRDPEGKMVAHAWLRSGPLYLTGVNEMHNFTVVGKFAKRIKNRIYQESASNG